MAGRVSKWKIGSGLDPDVQMGPAYLALTLAARDEKAEARATMDSTTRRGPTGDATTT